MGFQTTVHEDLTSMSLRLSGFLLQFEQNPVRGQRHELLRVGRHAHALELLVADGVVRELVHELLLEHGLVDVQVLVGAHDEDRVRDDRSGTARSKVTFYGSEINWL